ncbi:hypothetical protein Tco_0348279 [Tanacetum coccineum]
MCCDDIHSCLRLAFPPWQGVTLRAKTTAWNEFSSTMAFAIILFLDKQVEGMTKHKEIYVIPSYTKKKKQPRRKQRKDTKVPQPSGSTEPITDEAANDEHVPIHSNDPLLNGEDRLKLNELRELCTNLSQRVLDLENTKTSQPVEIAKLKEKESSEDEGLGAQEDASKQGRKIADLDADAETTLVDEA